MTTHCNPNTEKAEADDHEFKANPTFSYIDSSRLVQTIRQAPGSKKLIQYIHTINRLYSKNIYIAHGKK